MWWSKCNLERHRPGLSSTRPPFLIIVLSWNHCHDHPYNKFEGKQQIHKPNQKMSNTRHSSTYNTHARKKSLLVPSEMRIDGRKCIWMTCKCFIGSKTYFFTSNSWIFKTKIYATDSNKYLFDERLDSFSFNYNQHWYHYTHSVHKIQIIIWKSWWTCNNTFRWKIHLQQKSNLSPSSWPKKTLTSSISMIPNLCYYRILIIKQNLKKLDRSENFFVKAGMQKLKY